MSDQYPAAGGAAASEAAEPHIRGPLGEVGEPLEDSDTDLGQDRLADPSDLEGEDRGKGEALPPSPDQV